MVTLRGPLRRRVQIDDARGGEHFLQLTWHPDADVFVLSHWEGSVCLAATRIVADDAVGLLAVLADGLDERGLGPLPDRWPAPALGDRSSGPGLPATG